MKRVFVLALVAFLAVGNVFSQTLDDVWMGLRNGQVGKARKTMDEYMLGHENDADAWLMKGNVYIQVYTKDQERLAKDPAYVVRTPDAIVIANEAFYRAIELNKDVQPMTGMLGAIEGQALCGDAVFSMADAAAAKGDVENAIRYYNLAARDYKLAKNSVNAGVAYYSVATLYKQNGDKENHKATLLEIVKLKFPDPIVYLDLYDIYKAEKDTVNCGKIIKTAMKVVPADNQADIEATELDYFAMTGETEKLIKTCDMLVTKYDKSAPVLAMISNHLVNAGQFAKADSVIDKGLALSPDDPNMNYQKASRYFFEALANQSMQDQIMSDKSLTYAERGEKVNQLKAEQKAILEQAHTWSEKVYTLDPNDRYNNVMLQQIKVKLQKPVPDELKAKVDSYNKH